VAFPKALPCVHLGRHAACGWGGLGRQTLLPPLHDCPHHGLCCPQGVLPDRSGARACASCNDYLARYTTMPDSETMRFRAGEFLRMLKAYPQGMYRGRGIVIAGGGEKYFASLYVVIRAIRHVGCELPIELWYLGRNHELPNDRKAILEPYGVVCIDADEVRKMRPAKCLDGWPLKVYATLHSRFEEVLFLDADCYPCRNPEELFSNAEYCRLGSIFWPDTGGVDVRLKWAAFGVADPRRPMSVESGVYMVHKGKSWRPLNLAWFYNDESAYYYRYCYGDKHTFEVAWPATNQQYAMLAEMGRFDTVAYLHPGSDGKPTFVHRCCDKFRFAKHSYTTFQGTDVSQLYQQLPLEFCCWQFMEELSRLLRGITSSVT
jgi:hypothetical protein